jgi:hypothetical protein
MADHETESVAGLVRGILDDVRDLIREELALARAEIREEIEAAKLAAAAMGGAALAAAIGAVMLFIAIGNAISYLLAWPAWAGYGIVAVLLLAGAFGLVLYGRRRLAALRALPKTTETVKENLSWMQSKSAGK